MTPKEKEETMDDLQDEQIQDTENDSDLVLENEMRVELKQDGPNQSCIDVVLRDLVARKLDSYLSKEGLNIGKNEYCYTKIVGNHLEIGRAKIVLDE
jgi:hypothetical protein